MAFSSLRRREVLVGLSDHTLQCYNIESSQLIAKLPSHHHNAPHFLSIHPNEPLAISTCKSMPVLWDTDQWVRKRILMGSGDVGVQQASFSPDGTSILCTFCDGTMLIWNTITWGLEWKITLQISDDIEMNRLDTKGHFMRNSWFDMSQDGRLVAYGGITSSVFIWDLNDKKLLHEIIIPTFSDKWITSIRFVGDTNVR